MMKKSDQILGMDRDITRRDFIHDASLAALGLAMPLPLAADPVAGTPLEKSPGYYPPTRTGLRGSHPGSF